MAGDVSPVAMFELAHSGAIWRNIKQGYLPIGILTHKGEISKVSANAN